MKRITFVLFIILVSYQCINAQFLYLNDVELEGKEDFEEFSETVSDCCNYLLLTPYDKKDEQRIVATSFVKKWVIKHPDVEFVVGQKVMDLTEEKEELIDIYLVCVAKNLTNTEIHIENNVKLEELALLSFIEYCGKPMNKMKLTKEIKNLIELNNNGDLVALENYFATKNASN